MKFSKSSKINGNNGTTTTTTDNLLQPQLPPQPPRNRLYLKINAFRAADLAPSPNNNTEQLLSLPPSGHQHSHHHKRSLNPILIAQINQTQKCSSKKTNTNQPSWDDTLLLPLKHNGYSQLLILSVWDKHKRSKNYLGEVRLSLVDLFKKQQQFESKNEMKWYKLYSNRNAHAFVTGSILVSFELVVKKTRKDKRTESQVSSNGLENRTKKLSISSESSTKEPESFLDHWYNSLIYRDINPNSLKPDEQGFYPDAIDGALDQVISDIESLIEETPADNNNDVIPSSGSFISITTADRRLLGLLSDMNSSDAASFLSTDAEILATESDYSSMGPNDPYNQDKPPHPKSRRLRKLKLKAKNKFINNKFELSKRSVLGVVFIEIISCLDLPPMKNLTRTTFDMDPFVVATFGKKTFRTSWQRHTLNPTFNERVAFEMLPHESNYSIQFSVLDKDRFSFHDKVASISLPLRELTDYATVQPMVHSSGPSLDLFKNYYTNTSNSASNEGFTTAHESPLNLSVRIIDDDNLIKKTVKKKRFSIKKKKIIDSYVDTSKFRVMSLALDLADVKYLGKYKPELKIRIRFETYHDLRRKFWRVLLEQYNLNDNGDDTYDYFELISLLDTLGCTNSDDLVNEFYKNLDKLIWGGDLLSHDEIIDSLENYVNKGGSNNEKIFEFETCPICNKKRIGKKQDLDIITHFAICASKDWSIVNKLLVSSFVSPHQATKKWFTKVFIKLTYGKYTLGGNSANILVQDRMTGIILEEKMGVYVRLGIRLLYKGLDKARTKRVRILLRKLSFRQGLKFDQPQLKADIASFIKFHKLNLDDCMIEDPNEFSTFNEFFYRKLKPGARIIEDSQNPKIVLSPADCRCAVFDTVSSATQLWIKGKNFSIAKLFNGDLSSSGGYDLSDFYKPEACSLGIFRLAPQDYHRFHSPVSGKIGKIKLIEGEYYTVNPMAIRSELDVFGENIRSIIPIETEHFGTVIMVAVGAMMVGSIILSVKEGDAIHRGDEVGYFKFGGSTIVLLFEKKLFEFDQDLITNSKVCVETLVRVGQSVGHSPNIDEFKRDHIEFRHLSVGTKLKLIRLLTGGDLNDQSQVSNWEASQVSREFKLEYLQQRPSESSYDDYDDESFDEEGLVEEEEDE